MSSLKPTPPTTIVPTIPNPPNLSQASDYDIVARARKGDAAAQREIVRRYAHTVYDRIYRMVGHHELAEDLTQDTFAKAFDALARQDPERKPSAWILRIANNTAIDCLRCNRPDSTRSPLTVTPGHADLRARPMQLLGDTPTPRTDLRQLSAALQSALERLRPKCRRCFALTMSNSSRMTRSPITCICPWELCRVASSEPPRN